MRCHLFQVRKLSSLHMACTCGLGRACRRRAAQGLQSTPQQKPRGAQTQGRLQAETTLVYSSRTARRSKGEERCRQNIGRPIRGGDRQGAQSCFFASHRATQCLPPVRRLLGGLRGGARNRLRPLHRLLNRQRRPWESPPVTLLRAEVATLAAPWHRLPIALRLEVVSPRPPCARRPCSQSLHATKLANR